MIKAIVLKKEFINKEVFLLNIKCKSSFVFKAGQFITIKINDKKTTPCFRSYSISSEPKDNNKIELCIKKIENGRGSVWLSNLKKDDEIEMIGPSGNLTFNKTEKNSIFIATGTGVAPFKSIIIDQLLSNNKNNINLIFGVRSESDIFFKSYFKKLEKKYDNFKFTLTLSRPKVKTKDIKEGRVTKYLENSNLNKDSNYYICGLTPMIKSVVTILKNKNINPKNIHFEKYD